MVILLDENSKNTFGWILLSSLRRLEIKFVAFISELIKT